MNSILKQVTVAVIAVMACNVTAHAQEKGDMAVGGNVAVGTGDSYTNLGIGGKVQYNAMKQLRTEATFTYFLKKNYVTMWDANVNAHWLFPINDNTLIYPLAGIGILGTSTGIGEWGSASHSDVAFNIGGGIDIRLTDRVVFNAEAKYKISDVWDRLTVSAGINYHF